MDDLISRRAAIDDVEESRRLNHHQGGKEACAHEYEHRHFLKILMELPSAQPEPKKGKWIERECGTEEKEEGWGTVIVCSRCDFPATTFYSEDCESRTQIRTQFCPNCGADMREDT